MSEDTDTKTVRKYLRKNNVEKTQKFRPNAQKGQQVSPQFWMGSGAK